MSAGACRFCRCHGPEGDDACKVPGGDTCVWYLASRDVCTAPACINAYEAKRRLLIAQSSRSAKKRTPAEIHALIMDEKRTKQRAYRAKCKQQRGAA